jgi:hypothetical protein
MLFPDLPDIWEEETITQPNPIQFTAKPIGEQPKPIKVSVKPSGEFNFEGVADDNVIRQIITTTDYNRAASRKQELEILKQAKNVDMMTLCVLASSILVSLLCLFLSFNKNQQTQGSVANNGEFFRGISCGQVR